jgi:nitrite reductase/ring-hydroxylating ferredoxin subunit
MRGPRCSIGTRSYFYAISLCRNQVTDGSGVALVVPVNQLRRRLSIMTDFVTVAKIEDIPPGTGYTVEVHGVWIALFNVEGSFYAIDNTCPHAGGPLGEGHLDGCVVECPWHGWRFNVQTGERPENPSIAVTCCLVRIEGNQVQVALPEGFK